MWTHRGNGGEGHGAVQHHLLQRQRHLVGGRQRARLLAPRQPPQRRLHHIRCRVPLLPACAQCCTGLYCYWDAENLPGHRLLAAVEMPVTLLMRAEADRHQLAVSRSRRQCTARRCVLLMRQAPHNARYS